MLLLRVVAFFFCSGFWYSLLLLPHVKGGIKARACLWKASNLPLKRSFSTKKLRVRRKPLKGETKASKGGKKASKGWLEAFRGEKEAC